MKAIVQDGYGPADQVLRLTEVDKPVPAADEVSTSPISRIGTQARYITK